MNWDFLRVNEIIFQLNLKTLFTSILAFYHGTTSAQDSLFDPVTFDYAYADSIAVQMPKNKYKNYREVAGALSSKLQTDHEKFRAIFRWITDNIEYSYSNRTANVDIVFKKKKGVCIGNAVLLHKMCYCAGIDCEIVSGFTKREYLDIGQKLKESTHAWSAVKLYDKWYLCDPTWAAGNYDTKRKIKFEKKFKEFYFLTPPKLFEYKHFPEEEKWFLNENHISKKTLEINLYFTIIFINLISPNSTQRMDLSRLNLKTVWR
jgi:transglutaminase/protease-like cytokinesis protein 3